MLATYLYCRFPDCENSLVILNQKVNHDIINLKRNKNGEIDYECGEDAIYGLNIEVCECLCLHKDELQLLKDFLHHHNNTDFIGVIDYTITYQTFDISNDYDTGCMEEMDLHDYEDEYVDSDYDVILEKVAEDFYHHITITKNKILNKRGI